MKEDVEKGSRAHLPLQSTQDPAEKKEGEGGSNGNGGARFGENESSARIGGEEGKWRGRWYVLASGGTSSGGGVAGASPVGHMARA